RSAIAEGLNSDVLVLSGGVSAGVLDLVPRVLAELGVEQVFHKVNLKPGKPLWFGMRRGHSTTLVFGLPGNPVSTLVCFELFVRPAIRQLSGCAAIRSGAIEARLTQEFMHKGGRPTYYPARLEEGGATVTPLAWQGSADLRAFATANALIHFPGGDQHF